MMSDQSPPRGRIATVLTLARFEARQHLRSHRMFALASLLFLFIVGGSYGLSDPDGRLTPGIATDTPYEVLFLVSLFVLLSATLGVVLLGFDAISRRRLTKELAIELSQPISRSDLALAHLLGLWTAAFLPTMAATLVGVTMVHSQMDAWPTLAELAYFLGATALVLLWYSSIQLLASSLARDLGSAVTLGVGSWMLFTFVWLLVTAVLASIIGVDMTDLENQRFNRFSEIIDLFSPNGVYQLLLEDRLTGDAAPHLESRFIWLAAALWTLIPALLFTVRFRSIRP